MKIHLLNRYYDHVIPENSQRNAWKRQQSDFWFIAEFSQNPF